MFERHHCNNVYRAKTPPKLNPKSEARNPKQTERLKSELGIPEIRNRFVWNFELLALIGQNISPVERCRETGSLSPWRERVRVRGQKIKAPSPLSSPVEGEDASSITFSDNCTNLTLLPAPSSDMSLCQCQDLNNGRLALVLIIGICFEFRNSNFEFFHRVVVPSPE